ncbi:hypothetical protein BpHYR1_035802 [Brachionus plicatilis]|uniref:Uncharacterized protein n=1 Tax=Brachionus plicatilis TaxID=10195 RepID=A0A3M7QUP5_BRAPC|nr:hypothetical protein BpHYR1_035802 [Brachionus plicatilis]
MFPMENSPSLNPFPAIPLALFVIPVDPKLKPDEVEDAIEEKVLKTSGLGPVVPATNGGLEPKLNCENIIKLIKNSSIKINIHINSVNSANFTDIFLNGKMIIAEAWKYYKISKNINYFSNINKGSKK